MTTERSESCLICGQALSPTHVSARDRLVSAEGPFEVLECRACHLGVTVPQLSEQQLERYYPSEYYEDFYEHCASGLASPLHRLRERFRRFSAARRYSRPPFLLEGVTPGRMLDVGCGSGDLLEHFSKLGWEPYGIDPSEHASTAARRRGAQVHQGTLEDQPWPAGFFELITFQHSLEHIVDPLSALRVARQLLAPGGLMVVAVPNWDCWQRRFLFRGRWFHLDLPRHQQHFTVDALKRGAQALQMSVRASATTSTAISTAYSLHYLLAGHWTPGYKLWLCYPLSLPLLPFVWLVDRIGGGDCCYIVMKA